jgi:hypothetical protein
VSASFIPDSSAAAPKCATDIAGCSVTLAPQCAACNTGESCAFDDTCSPVCKKACVATCGTDEECYFASPDSPACRKKETFDAGSLAFTGTEIQLTLFPPYSFQAKSTGSPFKPGADLHVKASGASSAGFAAFEEDFTATTRVETKPALASIPAGVVFGNGPIPISWKPGADKVVVTVATKGGSVTCRADDAAGTFSVPREAIKAIVGKSTERSLQISVARVKKDVRKDKATKGELTSRTVQPTGWVELTTTSVEAADFQCAAGNNICGDACVDLRTSATNCGACGAKCGTGDVCSSGKCSGPTACGVCAPKATTTGACVTQDAACKASVDCAGIQTCVAACKDQTCAQGCLTRAPATAQNLYRSVAQCICDKGCYSECASACGRAP